MKPDDLKYSVKDSLSFLASAFVQNSLSPSNFVLDGFYFQAHGIGLDVVACHLFAYTTCINYFLVLSMETV